MVLRYPDALLDLCAQGVIQAQERLLDSVEMRRRMAEMNPVEALINQTYVVKDKITVRFTYLPPINEFCKPNISCIRSKDTNSLIQLSGTVIRSGLMKMLEYEKCYVCDKCGHEFVVAADIEQWNLLEDPKMCPMVGNSSATCKSTKFTLKSTECTDYQVLLTPSKPCPCTPCLCFVLVLCLLPLILNCLFVIHRK
jgi:DNA replicative helicase MCM subunit Mcm2 (Cdc46/Mcm family)